MPLPYQHLTSPMGGSGASPRSVSVSKDVANTPRAEPLEFSLEGTSQAKSEGVDEVDHISQRLTELQGELFLSLKEDISDWIVKTIGDTDINAENFVFALDTGVILCKLALAIEKKAKECYSQGLIKERLPDCKLQCNKNAKSGTWFARDNTANFLTWCRAYGMMDETLFDSEDLVTHHQERQVIYCLMEIARLGAKFGLEPPSLIVMEKEIDNQITPPPTPPTAPSPPPPSVKKLTPPPSPSPPPTVPSPSPPPIEPSPPPTPTPPPKKEPSISSKSSTVSTLDSEVNRVSTKCKCQEYVNKLSEGVYNVFGKRVFIRLLKGKHLMVRVGGGWDTFENYLLHHDPIQVFEFHSSEQYKPAHTKAYASKNFKPECLFQNSVDGSQPSTVFCTCTFKRPSAAKNHK